MSGHLKTYLKYAQDEGIADELVSDFLADYKVNHLHELTDRQQEILGCILEVYLVSYWSNKKAEEARFEKCWHCNGEGKVLKK